MTKRAIFLLLMLCYCACAHTDGLKLDGKLSFRQPLYDTTVPPDASTSILLHFDGNYADVGGSTWNPIFGAVTFGTFITDPVKFGTGAVLTTTANAGYLTGTNATAAVTVGYGDFTVEYWVNMGNLSGTTSQGGRVVDFRFYNGGNGYFLGSAGYFLLSAASYSPTIEVLGFNYSTAIASKIATDSYSTAENRWFHFCFERRSLVIYAYLDGKLMGQANMAGNYTPVSGVLMARTFYFPSVIAGDFVVDELRFYKNGYVYGGEFTPPTHPYGIARNNRLNIRRSTP